MATSDAASVLSPRVEPPYYLPAPADEQCPVCDTALTGHGRALVFLPVDAVASDTIADLIRRGGSDLLRTRGYHCARHQQTIAFAHTCDGPEAAGWGTRIGIHVEFPEREAWVPVTRETLGAPLVAAIEDVNPRIAGQTTGDSQ